MGPATRAAALREARISRHKLSLSALAALALVCTQFGVIRLSPWALPVRIAVPATIAAVPFALWPHRRWLGVWVVFVGLAANLAVILANGGLMPIDRDSVATAVGAEQAGAYASGDWLRGSKDVLEAPGDGRLTALGDSIALSLGRRGIVASPGDVVIACGVLILAAEASVGWQRSQRRRRHGEVAGRAGEAG
jgi:hypothetical protein